MGTATILAWGIGANEIIVILAILIFFFGAKKIPDLARGLGKSVSEFKKGKEEGGQDAVPPGGDASAR